MASGFKFSLSNNHAKRTKKPISFVPKSENSAEQKSYIVSLEDNQVEFLNPVSTEPPLIIPHIQVNQWRRGESSRIDGDEAEPPTQPIIVSRPPKKKITLESRTVSSSSSTDKKYGLQIMGAKTLESKASSVQNNSNSSLPLLLQNQLPKSLLDSSLAHDLSLRPNNVTEETYDRIPVEEYGAALLRGMGWDGDLGDVVKHEKRETRLGLGADVDIQFFKHTKRKK